MGEQAIISIQSVSKHFGSVVAVDDVNLEIRRGEFFSVLGPSGCGKTTLLRMLAGFEAPSSGEITIDGRRMSEIPAYRRPTNMVFQNYAIFPHLTVGRNIAFGLRKSDLSKSDIEARVEDMLALIKLPGYAKRTATELSGGERQRVALARALIMQPKVLLLDEPLGALDKNLREQMQIELRALQRSVGITFVFVTHDQEEALTLSDRIAVMAGGRLLQVDSPTGLYERPKSRFVAGFIGTTNLFEGRVSGLEDGTAIVDAGPLGPLRVLVDAELPTRVPRSWSRFARRSSPSTSRPPTTVPTWSRAAWDPPSIWVIAATSTSASSGGNTGRRGVAEPGGDDGAPSGGGPTRMAELQGPVRGPAQSRLTVAASGRSLWRGGWRRRIEPLSLAVPPMVRSTQNGYYIAQYGY